MDKHNPAFPVVIPNAAIDFDVTPGLTKREFFAAMAMVGYLADGSTDSRSSIGLDSVLMADQLMKNLRWEMEDQ